MKCEHIIVLGDNMNHKQLLALFLCFVIILSSKLVIGKKQEVVEVKNVSSNTDKYTIENISEKNEDYNIDVYYPVTKCKEANDSINNKINEYIEQCKNNKKSLIISFEEYEYKDYESYKFVINMERDKVHKSEEIYTITFNENGILDLNKYMEINSDVIKERVKSDSKYKEYVNDERLNNYLSKENILNNFILTENSIVLYFNANTMLPNVAGIVQIEIPYEII